MSRFLVIGGTGSLGEAFTRKALELGHDVTCFSRDELKQKDLAFKLGSRSLKFIIGDIRDQNAVIRATRGHESVFLFAALKHVDTLEAFPEEAYKTNVQGTVHVLNAVEDAGVKNFVFSSTDKAVDPINAYGFSKSLAEKIIQARTGKYIKKIYRWGNVVGSRGSVIPHFVRELRAKHPKIEVTDMAMTRFWIKIEDAVNFVYETFDKPQHPTLLIPPIKAASVPVLVAALAKILKTPYYDLKVVGIRPGEKIHERLRSQHENWPDSSHSGLTFQFPELVEYLRPAVEALV